MNSEEPLDSLQTDEAGTDHQRVADEQFAHGLLITLEENRDADQARVRRVMQAISSQQSNPIRKVGHFRFWQVASSIAAALLLGLGIFFLSATQQSATATLSLAIDATRSAGDRSYVVIFPDRLQAPFGSLDVRSDDQYVFRTRTPEGHMLIAGVDESGQWSLGRDGSVRRERALPVPKWVEIGGGSLLVASLDGMLSLLPSTYDLEVLEPAALQAGDENLMTRIKASPMNAQTPGPKQVDLWIDPTTQLVRRMRFKLGTPREQKPPKGPRGGPGRHGAPPPPPGGGPPRGGRRPAPPSEVQFELLEQAPLPANWFSPEAHLEDSGKR